jgi:hypothetical protein
LIGDIAALAIRFAEAGIIAEACVCSCIDWSRMISEEMQKYLGGCGSIGSLCWEESVMKRSARAIERATHTKFYGDIK